MPKLSKELSEEQVSKIVTLIDDRIEGWKRVIENQIDEKWVLIREKTLAPMRGLAAEILKSFDERIEIKEPTSRAYKKAKARGRKEFVMSYSGDRRNSKKKQANRRVKR